jgi:branched-chain amino acid transport system substrate-binding protein
LALKLGKQVITTGGSQSPDQLVAQAGAAADGSVHLVFFSPWTPDKTAHPEQSKAFIDAWSRRGFAPGGLTESFRGYDGIQVIAAAIRKAGSTDPDAIRQAMWSVAVPGLNGMVSFKQAGPAGKESGQSIPQVYFVKIDDGKIKLVE